jgi:AraC-like DNA-binding protein
VQLQSLPAHVSFTTKKRTGPRVVVRGARTSRIPRMTQALWPKDGLAENTLPSLACVIRGTADLHINDYVMSCHPGDFVFQPAGIAVSDGTRPHFESECYHGRHCSLLWIYPGRLLGEGLMSYLCHSEGQTHSTGKRLWCKNHLLSELFTGIQEECNKPQRREGLYHLIAALLCTFQQEIIDGRTSLAPYYFAEELPAPTDRDPIQQACSYIDAHLSLNLTIERVARHVCLSPSTFTRRFKQQTHQTFNQYCTAMRLKAAGVWLTTTETDIRTVARSVGLTDHQLRLLARRHWGCLPSDYRKRKS